MRTYPRWIHHPQKESVVVLSAAHEASLGDGWYDSPADFPQAAAPPVPIPEPPKNRGGRPRKVAP